MNEYDRAKLADDIIEKADIVGSKEQALLWFDITNAMRKVHNEAMEEGKALMFDGAMNYINDKK